MVFVCMRCMRKPKMTKFEQPTGEYNLNNNACKRITDECPIRIGKHYKHKMFDTWKLENMKFELPQVEGVIKKFTDENYSFCVRAEGENGEMIKDWSRWVYQEIGKEARKINGEINKRIKDNKKLGHNYFAKEMFVPVYKHESDGSVVYDSEGEKVIDKDKSGNLYLKMKGVGWQACLCYGINRALFKLDDLLGHKVKCIPTITFHDIFYNKEHLTVRYCVSVMLVTGLEKFERSTKKDQDEIVVNPEILKGVSQEQMDLFNKITK